MNEPNKGVLVGGFIIIGVGTAHALVTQKPVSPVLVGGVGFVLLASLLDALGDGWSTLASALVALAVTAVLLVDGLPLLSYLQKK